MISIWDDILNDGNKGLDECLYMRYLDDISIRSNCFTKFQWFSLSAPFILGLYSLVHVQSSLCIFFFLNHHSNWKMTKTKWWDRFLTITLKYKVHTKETVDFYWYSIQSEVFFAQTKHVLSPAKLGRKCKIQMHAVSISCVLRQWNEMMIWPLRIFINAGILIHIFQ